MIAQGVRVHLLRFGFARILLIDGTANALRLSRRKIPATDAQLQRNLRSRKQYSPCWVDARPQSFENDMPLCTEEVVRGRGECGHYGLWSGYGRGN